MNEADCIFLKAVRTPTHIGVPDAERARAQSVEIDLSIYPSTSLKSLKDSIELTIDYGMVAETLFEVAASHPRKLIETLAEDIAAEIFSNFGVARLSVRISKQILPGMEAAGLEMHFDRDEL